MELSYSKDLRIRKNLLHNFAAVVLITFAFATFNLSNAAQFTTCMCPRDGYVSYTGTCPDPNQLMVVKRTLMARTQDRSVPDFCSRTVQLSSPDCILEDVKSSWPVRSTCNARNGTCLVSYNLDAAALNECTAKSGYVYSCLNYECFNRSQNSNSGNTNVYLTSQSQQTNDVGPSFQMMTSYYPSATSSSKGQCTMKVPANLNVLIRIQDFRSRFIGEIPAGERCPYWLYVNSGTNYKEWCSSSTWSYDELRINRISDIGDRNIDVVFYSKFPEGRTEGAVWLSIESSSRDRLTVQCGNGIPLYNTTGHVTSSPSSSTKTTTFRPPSSSPSTSPSTTKNLPGPPGVGSSSTRPPVGPSSTSPSTSRTTSRAPSSTTRAPVGPSSTSSTTKPGVSTSTSPRSSTTRASGPSSTTSKAISGPSSTPGVPTPGVPTGTDPNAVANTADVRDPNAVAYTNSKGNSNTVRVAIAVTVIVVGLILIASLVMALIWFFRWRHEKRNESGLTSSENNGDTEGYYEE